MAQRVVGIDLGSYSVKAVTLTPRSKAARPSGSRQSFEVLGFGEAVVPPAAVGEGVPDAAATLRERQGEALADLKRRGLLEGDVFVTGLPGDAAAVKTLLFPFNDREKIAEALPYTLEGEIALDVDDVVWSFAQLPARDKTSREAEVLCAFARKEAVQEVLDLLAVQGIDPRHVELDALALDDLWEGLFAVTHDVEAGPDAMGAGLTTYGGTVIETSEGAPAPAVAVVDIGHRRTSVCVLQDGNVISAHTLLHGGADATRALAKDIGLPLDEAERGKRKEAFLEVTGAVAQFPEQHQISDVLKKAYAPIGRRLRQIFQATISSSRVRVVKVVLTGGGSKVLNLDRHLAEELNIKVARGHEVGATLRAAQFAGKNPLLESDDGAEAALAFAYALSGIAGPRTRARIDFRTGPFAWQGDYDFLRERLPALGAWAAALLLVVAGGSLTQAIVLSREDRALLQRQLALCEQITGEKSDSTSRCLALIHERIAGTAGFQVPEHSAVDVFLEISRRLPYPAEIKRKITELDITSERVRLKGTTTSYDAIDTLVERLQGGKCFQLVEKGKARNINDSTVELNVTINLDCAAAPGDGKLPPPPPAPTAASLRASSAATSTNTPGATPGATTFPPATVSPPRGRDEDATPAVDEARHKRPSNEDIEARKERLKKLREDREARRRQLLDSPTARPNLRDRFQKPSLPLDRDSPGEQ
jgi:general secretion pathway protein L